MIGLATILACFWQMIRVNRREQANPMPADVYAALNPSAWELADLLFNTKSGEFWAGLGYILKGILAALRGLVGFMKQATADPDPLRFSHYEVPEYWHTNTHKETVIVEDFEVKGGGFPVAFDGQLIRSLGETRAGAIARKEADKTAEITAHEQKVLSAYDPPLHNITLARQVKTYLQEGKTDKETAALCGYSVATVKHYRLALEKAAETA